MRWEFTFFDSCLELLPAVFHFPLTGDDLSPRGFHELQEVGHGVSRADDHRDAELLHALLEAEDCSSCGLRAPEGGGLVGEAVWVKAEEGDDWPRLVQGLGEPGVVVRPEVVFEPQDDWCLGSGHCAVAIGLSLDQCRRSAYASALWQCGLGSHKAPPSAVRASLFLERRPYEHTWAEI